MSSFKKLCEPAKLYLVVSAIFLILAIFSRISAFTLIVKGVFILIWTMVLNWLCSKGFKGLAWIIVLLPFVFLFMATFTTIDMMGMRYDGFVGVNPRANREAARTGVPLSRDPTDPQHTQVRPTNPVPEQVIPTNPEPEQVIPTNPVSEQVIPTNPVPEQVTPP